MIKNNDSLFLFNSFNSLDHTLDRWEQSGYYCEEDQKVIDSVYETLEGSVDKYYDKIEKAKKKQPDMEW